jgi:membrane dipeptidase
MIEITKSQEERVAELHEKVPFVNASDTTAVVTHSGFSKTTDLDAYVEKLKKGKVTIASLSFLSWAYDNFVQASKTIYKFYRLLDKYKDDVSLITARKDVEEVIRNGKIGFIMHFHNTSMIDDDVGLLSILHKLGLRVMQLTYQGRNLVGDGCGEKSGCGLSSFGYKVVDEMNRLHILIDLTHSGPKTYMDTLEFSKDPVVYTHGCVKAFCDIPPGRHLSDEQIHALGEKGGVMGMMAKHLNSPLDKEGKVQGMPMSLYMKHMERVVDLVGIDHVGIGTENGEGRSVEDGFSLAREFTARYYKPEEVGLISKPLLKAQMKGAMTTSDYRKRYAVAGTETVLTVKRNLLREFVGRGYSDQDIAKILGGNFLRIYKKIW